MSSSFVKLGAPPPSAESFQLEVTDRAAEQLLKIRSQTGQDGASFRIGVQGGGCSGFTYKMEFDQQKHGDIVAAQKDGLSVIVDPISAPLLNHATVDFALTLEESGFKIRNPNAKEVCSCGKSFG
jgi:iron-sulfur cluster assembly protein